MSLLPHQQPLHEWHRRRAAYEDTDLPSDAQYPEHDHHDSHAALLGHRYDPPPYIRSRTPSPSPALVAQDASSSDENPELQQSPNTASTTTTTTTTTTTQIPTTVPQEDHQQQQLPPEYQPPPPPAPPPPNYADADTELITVSLRESQLLPPPAPDPAQPSSSSGRRMSSFLSKLKPQNDATHIIVMTRGDYHRYWARDKKGKYVGSEPEGEGPRIWRERMHARSKSVAGPVGGAAGAGSRGSVSSALRGGSVSVGGGGSNGSVARSTNDDPVSSSSTAPERSGSGSDDGPPEIPTSPSNRKSDAVEALFSQLDRTRARGLGPGAGFGYAEGSGQETAFRRALYGSGAAPREQAPGLRRVVTQPPT